MTAHTYWNRLSANLGSKIINTVGLVVTGMLTGSQIGEALHDKPVHPLELRTAHQSLRELEALSFAGDVLQESLQYKGQNPAVLTAIKSCVTSQPANLRSCFADIGQRYNEKYVQPLQQQADNNAAQTSQYVALGALGGLVLAGGYYGLAALRRREPVLSST